MPWVKGECKEDARRGEGIEKGSKNGRRRMRVGGSTGERGTGRRVKTQDGCTVERKETGTRVHAVALEAGKHIGRRLLLPPRPPTQPVPTAKHARVHAHHHVRAPDRAELRRERARRRVEGREAQRARGWGESCAALAEPACAAGTPRSSEPQPQRPARVPPLHASLACIRTPRPGQRVCVRVRAVVRVRAPPVLHRQQGRARRRPARGFGGAQAGDERGLVGDVARLLLGLKEEGGGRGEGRKV
ncbi:hypothetical protein C8F04DRAFT_1242619 [Mycena alexandri]|uniref:Uncharacterized protein n=1 Tax=Mycena alexandri TaxID=1745969 RepID=A0AAD6S1Y2_9AGAR|nr:hypothetical protein C8F04DRAFT_1242619 [Mycena alexandri]